jgi:AbrB family looped-hinge helix DNA binding protein
MNIATLTSKGQLTVPKAVRDALGLSPGDRVNFVRMEDGNFAIMPATVPVRSLKGLLRKPARPVTLEDMADAIASGAKGE